MQDSKLINLKTYYNQNFLKHTRHFITKEAEKYSEGTSSVDNQSLSSNQRHILRKMNLDSPLHTTIPNLIPKNDIIVSSDTI